MKYLSLIIFIVFAFGCTDPDRPLDEFEMNRYLRAKEVIEPLEIQYAQLDAEYERLRAIEETYSEEFLSKNLTISRRSTRQGETVICLEGDITNNGESAIYSYAINIELFSDIEKQNRIYEWEAQVVNLSSSLRNNTLVSSERLILTDRTEYCENRDIRFEAFNISDGSLVLDGADFYSINDLIQLNERIFNLKSETDFNELHRRFTINND